MQNLNNVITEATHKQELQPKFPYIGYNSIEPFRISHCGYFPPNFPRVNAYPIKCLFHVKVYTIGLSKEKFSDGKSKWLTKNIS